MQKLTVYECENCHDCPYKTECIIVNNCRTRLEDRIKRLYISRRMEEKRKECLEHITSDYETQLRMNRSIYAKDSFAIVKDDMNFRRYPYRGKDNVLTQSLILAIGFDMIKLHHKIMSGRTGKYLFKLNQTA